MKKTTLMAFLCFIFYYSTAYYASEDNLHEQPFHEERMKQIVNSSVIVLLHDVYSSPPPRKAPAPKRIFDPYALFDAATHLPMFKHFSFARAVTQSLLPGEIIGQTLANFLSTHKIFQKRITFSPSQDGKDQKNISMGALFRNGQIVIPHGYKIFESGAESKLESPSARTEISRMLEISEEMLELGKYTRSAEDFSDQLNIYLDIFWDINTPLNEEEQFFLSDPDSRFTGTILASRNMFSQIQTIVDFVPKDDVIPIKVAPNGPFYEALKELKNTSNITTNNIKIKRLLRDIQNFMKVQKSIPSLYNTIIKKPTKIVDYITLNAEETDVVIFGGYLHIVFQKIQENQSTLNPKTPQTTIDLFEENFTTTYTFIENIIKAFDNEIYSRICSEQKIILDRYFDLQQLISQIEVPMEAVSLTPYTLVIDTHKFPCPACRMTFPRAIDVFEKEFGIDMQIRVNYHADYPVNSGEEDIDERATAYARTCGVVFTKLDLCSPCIERAPLKTGSCYTTPIKMGDIEEKKSSTTGGRIEKHAKHTLKKGEETEYDPFDNLCQACEDDYENDA